MDYKKTKAANTTISRNVKEMADKTKCDNFQFVDKVAWTSRNDC